MPTGVRLLGKFDAVARKRRAKEKKNNRTGKACPLLNSQLSSQWEVLACLRLESSASSKLSCPCCDLFIYHVMLFLDSD